MPTHGLSLSSCYVSSSVRVSVDVYSDPDNVDPSGSFFRSHYPTYAQMLVLDYKQFKAARLIQTQVRGFLARSLIRRWNRAARILAGAWRKFVAKRNLMACAELRLQCVVIASFDAASIRIQAFYRGFSSRRYNSNMIMLNNIQKKYIEGILKICAHRLRIMQNNGELPGYLDFCNEQDNSKMCDLLSMLTYRIFNRSVCCRYLLSTGMLHQLQREFLDSVCYTQVPYASFDDGRFFRPSHDKDPKDYGLREYDMAQALLRQGHLIFTNKHGPTTQKEEELCPIKRELDVKRFCKHLVVNMNKWPVCPVLGKLTEANLREYLEDAKECLEEIHFLPKCNGCKTDDS